MSYWGPWIAGFCVGLSAGIFVTTWVVTKVTKRRDEAAKDPKKPGDWIEP